MSRSQPGSPEYFSNQLNYTIGDEDTRLELGILPEGLEHVVSIAGSGGRALPLLARRPKRLTCIDISPPQLHLTELRIEAARVLPLEEYLGLLGFPPSEVTPKAREGLFRKLALTPPARAFFEGLFEATGWGPLIYLGRFEQMLRTLAKVNSVFTGKAGRGIFEATTLDEQARYLQTRFPLRAWKAVLFLMGNAAVLNSLLYKGELPKQNIPGTAYQFYKDSFSRLFSNSLARQSYFLQMVFFGQLRFPEGNPVECDPAVYAQAQRALENTQVSYVLGDVLSFIQGAGGSIGLASLSDVPTFFKGPAEETFLQDIRPGLAPGAVVVTRGHLRVCHPDATGYEVITSEYERLLKEERTQLWHVQVYRARA